MRNTMLACAMLAATIGVMPATADELARAGAGQKVSLSQVPSITRGDIARLKSVLNLTAQQQRYWPAVESALHAIEAQQSADPEAAGTLARLRSKVASVALTTSALQRIASAAMPLFGSLDDAQRRDATRFVRGMGMGHLAAAF